MKIIALRLSCCRDFCPVKTPAIRKRVNKKLEGLPFPFLSTRYWSRGQLSVFHTYDTSNLLHRYSGFVGSAKFSKKWTREWEDAYSLAFSSKSILSNSLTPLNYLITRGGKAQEWDPMKPLVKSLLEKTFNKLFAVIINFPFTIKHRKQPLSVIY